MKKPSSPKTATQTIVISDPDGEILESKLEGRSLSPELFKFLNSLVKTNKWTRKITVPSTHDDVAVVLLFTSNLKETGLEILSEIHVFFKGKTLTEKWEMLPENKLASSLQPNVFSSLDVEKVRVEGTAVHVALRLLVPTGEQKKVLKTYDFSIGEPTTHTKALPGKRPAIPGNGVLQAKRIQGASDPA